MNKQEFIAWLEGYVAGLHEGGQDVDIVSVSNTIVEMAKMLEDTVPTNIPYIPWNEPWKPYWTYVVTTAKDILPNPDDWWVDTSDDGTWSIKKGQ